MTTPSEGPGWQPGSFLDSSDWLRNLSEQDQQNLIAVAGMTPEQRQAAMNFANLDDRQQANLMRAANTDPIRDRIANAYRGAVAQVHLTYDNTRQRISEGAQTLATQAREYRDAGVAVYNRGVDRANEFGQQIAQGGRDVRDAAVGVYNRGVDRANEFGQQVAATYQGARDGIVDAAQRGQVRLDQAWQAGADRLNETGQQIAGAYNRGVERANEFGQQVAQGARDARTAAVGAGRDAVTAVRNAPGKVGRWFEGKFNSTMLKAESSLASFNAGRHDPTLQSTSLSSRDRLEMAERFSEAMRAPNLEARNEILQGMAQASQAQVDAQTQEAQQTAMRAFSGVAPAGQAVSTPAQPQTSGQGEQAKPDLTKNTNKDGINR